MSDCPKCNSSVPTHSKVCHECGAPVEQATPPETKAPHADDEVHSFLLNAYLLKIRGDSDGAVQECIKALRVNPDSVEAHSLLGDIYKGQGKMEDAMHWYKLALDIKPDSQADRDRLEQLSTENPSLKARSEEKLPVILGKGPSLVALGVLGVILLVFVLTKVSPFSPPKTSKPPAEHVDVKVTPAVPPRPVSIPPVVPKEQRAETPQPADIQGSTYETGLLSKLNSLSSLSGNSLRVTGIVVDPRSNSATVTFTGAAAEDGYELAALVRNGLLVIREVLLNDNLISYVTVRAVYPKTVEDAVRQETVFIGGADRGKALNANPDTATYEAQFAVFENAWWHQSLK